MRTMRNRNMEGLLTDRLGAGGPLPSGGGPNPYGSFHRKDRVDFSDALLTPEERKSVALQGHYTGNPDVAEIMRKDRDKAERTRKEFASSGKRVDVPAEEEGVWDKIKSKVGEGVDWLSGATAHKEGAEAAYAPSHGMALDPHWQKKSAEQREGWAALQSEPEVMVADESSQLNMEELDQPLGPDALDVEGLIDQSMPVPTGPQMVGRHAPVAGPVGGPSPHAGMPVAESLLAPEDTGKKKKKKGLSKSEKAGYAKMGEMLMDSGSAPDMRPPAPPALSIKQGQIAFPGLLAQQAPVQQRYTPRGLV